LRGNISESSGARPTTLSLFPLILSPPVELPIFK
jgi:hypothetical protein